MESKYCDKTQIKKKKLEENRGRRCKELNEDEKNWLIEFLNWSDIRTLILVAKTTFTSGNLTAKENINNGTIFCGLCVMFFQSPVVLPVVKSHLRQSSAKS